MLVDNLRYIAKGSDSIRTAMSTVYRELQSIIATQFEIEYTISQVDTIFRAQEFRVRGKVIKLCDIASPLEAAWQPIQATAHSLWGNGNDLDAVVLSGGGAPVFESSTRSVYEQTLPVEDDPVMGNAEGFGKWGKRQFR